MTELLFLVSNGINAVPNFRLTNNSPVFAIRESKDLLGISTNALGIGSTGGITGIGSTAYRLFFDGFGSGKAHSLHQQNLKSQVLQKKLLEQLFVKKHII